MCKRIWILLSLMWFSSLSLLSARVLDIELVHGDIKLVVNQKTGAYFMYYVRDAQLGKYEPLFSDRKYATSYLKIRTCDQEYNPLRDQNFSITCEVLAEENDTVVVTYRSSMFDVEQRMSFLYETTLDTAYGIQIDWKITSKFEVTENFAAKYILDTSVGEGNVPFLTDQMPSITKEQQLIWPYKDLFVVTPANKYSLMVMLQGTSVSTPSRVIFANWQRLFDSGWTYETMPNRNFSLLPYSVDDSALCLYWPAEYLDPNESMTISMALGCYREGGLVPVNNDMKQKVEIVPPPVSKPPVVPVTSADPEITSDVEVPVTPDPKIQSPEVPDATSQSEILRLIDRIDFLMLHPEEAGVNEIDALEAKLLELQNKAAESKD